MSPIIQT